MDMAAGNHSVLTLHELKLPVIKCATKVIKYESCASQEQQSNCCRKWLSKPDVFLSLVIWYRSAIWEMDFNSIMADKTISH